MAIIPNGPTSEAAQRLHARIPAIVAIQDITRQPGLSLGVIHLGRRIFEHHAGTLDLGTCQEPNGDTLYCIASLSKAFMTASLDLLVRDDKISWDSTVASILPDFGAGGDVVYANMTVRDICSHRSGLLSLDEFTQGLDARILLDKKDAVKVCGALPAKHRLRTKFLYNNALFELAGKIVEHVSGAPTWGDFQQDRIFGPLGMTRTTAFRAVHQDDTNIATPYMALTTGELSQIAPTELDANSMNGGSGGVRTSVNDLLKWAGCLLKSFSPPPDGYPDTLVRHMSPLWERCTIGNATIAMEGDYCLGWCHHRTPAKLGLISPNRTLESPVLGAASGSMLFYSHQGDVPGYTCNLYLMPETESAIVVLSNGTGLSDATDWIAQDLIQALFKLEPAIDFIQVAVQAQQKYLSHFVIDFQMPLEEHRQKGTPMAQPDDFVGLYTMQGLDVATIDISINQSQEYPLLMTMNRQPDQVWKLWHYHNDVFCQLPPTYDECLIRGLDRTTWSSFLISFVRDHRGTVQLLSWEMDDVKVQFLRSALKEERA
jgi:CubicO group peptidase (beta-lactamase class C family)